MSHMGLELISVPRQIRTEAELFLFLFFSLSFFVTLCRFGNHLYKESIQENGGRNILSEQMPSLQPLKGHSRETWRAKTKPDVAQICAVCEEERD